MINDKRKIAVITITMNDDYKINEWVRWYREYQDEVGKFIIVDNNSTIEYKELLYTYFSNAQIIELDYNGGCTGAYNAGIKCALSDVNVTHIALVGNDIRIEKGALNACVDLLETDDNLGMVEPVILEADSNIVCDFGCSISRYLTMLPEGVGRPVNELPERIRYCECVTGGMNVSKREFYEKVGFQDENLFMYSDEVDMGIRAKNSGYRFAVLRDAKAWHQHVNPPRTKKRLPFSQYLIGRNKVYLAHKHFGAFRVLCVFTYFSLISIKMVVKGIFCRDKSLLVDAMWLENGAVHGLLGAMKANRFSTL